MLFTFCVVGIKQAQWSGGRREIRLDSFLLRTNCTEKSRREYMVQTGRSERNQGEYIVREADEVAAVIS